jgi:hypothetical protein
MRRATNLFLLATFLIAGSAFGQSTDYSFNVDLDNNPDNLFPTSIHSGVRTVAGPYDLDGDGLVEILVSDYTGGGRVYVLENVGPDLWEHVYSTPVLDEYPGTNNGRVIAGGDMDGDGKGEIYFFSGRSFDAASTYPVGLYVFEYTGIDNDYGTVPTTIYEMPDAPNRWRQEQLIIQDIDNDGQMEMMFGNNGNNDGDNWWVISVTGDIGSGFETWSNEAFITSRNRGLDPVDRGGGSPYSMVAADLDGNGINELVMGSWNGLNITLGQATAPDTYFFPDGSQGDIYNHISGGEDNVSLFGLVVVDIDGDGNDEVFGSEYSGSRASGGDVYVINYDPGENVFAITEDNFTYDVVPGLSSLGLTAGDLDGDGNMDLIGTGSSYTHNQFDQDFAPNWVNIVEFIGDDPENPAHYSDIVQVFFPNDMTDSFDLVNFDSLGTTWQVREKGDNGPQFVSKLAFLGDADNDGFNEVAIGFQGQNDSLRTFSMVWSEADTAYVRTQTDVRVNSESRVFMRVLSAGATGISIEEERVIIPTDYKLEQNYPNPFNPTTNIRFELPRDKAVSLTIFDVSGRIVKRLVDNQFMSEGTHEIQWDGTSDAGGQVASGTYLYRLQFGNFAHTKTMVLLK